MKAMTVDHIYFNRLCLTSFWLSRISVYGSDDEMEHAAAVFNDSERRYQCTVHNATIAKNQTQWNEIIALNNNFAAQTVRLNQRLQILGLENADLKMKLQCQDEREGRASKIPGAECEAHLAHSSSLECEIGALAGALIEMLKLDVDSKAPVETALTEAGVSNELARCVAAGALFQERLQVARGLEQQTSSRVTRRMSRHKKSMH